MYAYLMILMLFCIGVVITLVSIPHIDKLLDRGGLIRQNYRGNLIPVGMGIVFIPALLINSTILLFSNVKPERITNILVLSFGIITMCLVGLMDDTLGNRNDTGLKGHFVKLFKGDLTTGAFKALVGGFVGLFVSVTLSKNPLDIIVGTLVIALATNFMNLLDLRPGRAIKVYLFIVIICLIFCSKFERELMMLILPAVVAYFYYDLKAMAMMGDAGSNILGVSMGIFIVLAFDIKVKIAVLILLIAIHVLTEFYSLTKIIEKNSILNKIDKFGRE